MDNENRTGLQVAGAISCVTLVISICTCAHSFGDVNNAIERLQLRQDNADIRELNINRRLDKIDCELTKNLGEVKAGKVFYVDTYQRRIVQVGLKKYGILTENSEWTVMGFVSTLAEVKKYMEDSLYRTVPTTCDD